MLKLLGATDSILPYAATYEGSALFSAVPVDMPALVYLIWQIPRKLLFSQKVRYLSFHLPTYQDFPL